LPESLALPIAEFENGAVRAQASLPST
jgi:hypothetical protein